MDGDHCGRSGKGGAIMTDAQQLTYTLEPLPDKPSRLIRVALADLIECEGCGKYEIKTSGWHKPLGGGRCEIGLAGAVMAIDIGVPHTRRITNLPFDIETCKRLWALNCFSIGQVSVGLFLMELFPCVAQKLLETYDKRLLDRAIPKYEDGRDAFFKEMTDLSSELGGMGL